MPFLRAQSQPVTRRAAWNAASALVTVLIGCAPNVPVARLDPSEPGFWDYEIDVGSDADLRASGVLRGPLAGPLEVDGTALGFVSDVEAATESGFRPIEWQSETWSAECRSPCRIRYRMNLREAATRLADVETAWAAGGVVVSPPSTWLLHPRRVRRGQYRFHVEPQSPLRFVTGVRPAKSGAGDTYEADIASLGESAFSAFGALHVAHLADPQVEVVIAQELPLPEAAVMSWLRAELRAITAYFGRMPDDRLVFFVTPGSSEVMRGETLGGGGASILLRVGTKVTEATLRDDWVAAHELVHASFPNIAYEHGWFSEGLATYVEPLARVRAGLLTARRMWADLVTGLPQGLPGQGDTGLEGSREWGRVYWGGALYFLMADLQIRDETSGARSLGHALRGIAASGANVEQEWSLTRVLDEGDRATGTRVLHDLYDRMAKAPGTFDLGALWARLGIRRIGNGIQFDDSAPAAALRRAITQPESGAVRPLTQYTGR